MKNQYAGDIGDYTKLGILRAINKANFSLGINWYLTPNEPTHSKFINDGKYTNYLKLECDTPDKKLFSTLEKIGLSDCRSVEKIEQAKLFSKTKFYSDILVSKYRDEWHKNAMKQLSGKDIIFCDPDNGLEVKSTKPYSKKGNKYTTYQEIVDYYKKGSSVIVYNHRDRKPEEIYLKRFTKFKEIKETNDAKLFYIRASRLSVRDYLFIVHKSHIDSLEKSINELLETEWGNYLKKYSI